MVATPRKENKKGKNRLPDSTCNVGWVLRYINLFDHSDVSGYISHLGFITSLRFEFARVQALAVISLNFRASPKQTSTCSFTFHKCVSSSLQIASRIKQDRYSVISLSHCAPNGSHCKVDKQVVLLSSCLSRASRSNHSFKPRR